MIGLQPKSVRRRHPLRKRENLIATWFGSGFITPGPGTWGTLAALPWGIAFLFAGKLTFLTFIIAMTAVGYWACRKFEDASGDHDSAMIVVDEAIGIWIALLAVSTPIQILLAFILFRVFDIFKPWPIGWLDKNVQGPAGVLADDIAAGIAAALCLLGLNYVGLG